MKFKKITISILIIFTIVSIHVQSFAKYTFEYTKTAAQIIIIN